MKSDVFRLFGDERGQDLIEYALLTTLIGLACIAVFDLIRSAIYNVYLSWNTSANSNWRPPDPTP
jgi:Flp pilus assembly pilin Flp